MTEWQPIETAPMDNSALLLCCSVWPPSAVRGVNPPIKVGGWDVDGCRWHVFGAPWLPTHWMPLPAPPKVTNVANVKREPFSNEVWSIACKHFDTMERSQEIPMLCRAILAERERCAQIADEQAGWGVGCNPVMLGKKIADLIRGEA